MYERNILIKGKHATYMKELVSLNNLPDATIHAGQYLTVSYYSDIQK